MHRNDAKTRKFPASQYWKETGGQDARLARTGETAGSIARNPAPQNCCALRALVSQRASGGSFFMSNWIENCLIITKGDPAVVWDAIRGENSPFDFNRLIPMPEGFILK